MGLADIHIHSDLSDGISGIDRILEYVQEKTDLDVIAITDHDRIEGSYEARELAAKMGYRFEVVVGMEVTTSEGHLLALFLEKPLPRLRPVEATIVAAQAQGGLCIVPHPLSRQQDSLGQLVLERLLVNGHRLDGLEISDPQASWYLCSEDVGRLNDQQYHLAEIGGSDAHGLAQIGTRYTIFPGRTAAELKQSILDKRTRSRGRSYEDRTGFSL